MGKRREGVAWVIGWQCGEVRGRATVYALTSHAAIDRFLEQWLRDNDDGPDTFWVEVCAYCHHSHEREECEWEGRIRTQQHQLQLARAVFDRYSWRYGDEV